MTSSLNGVDRAIHEVCSRATVNMNIDEPGGQIFSVKRHDLGILRTLLGHGPYMRDDAVVYHDANVRIDGIFQDDITVDENGFHCDSVVLGGGSMICFSVLIGGAINDTVPSSTTLFLTLTVRTLTGGAVNDNAT